MPTRISWPPRSISLLGPLALLAGGCGSDAASTDAAPDAVGLDAPGPDALAGPDLSCLGDPLPGTAAPSVTLTGIVYERRGNVVEPVAGVAGDAFAVADPATSLGQGTSAADTGDYAITLATGGAPVDLFLLHTGPDLLDNYTYPPAPVSADRDGVDILMISPGQFALFEALAEVQQDPERGFVAVATFDCAGRPLAGVSITTTPPAGQVLYAGASSLPDEAATATSSIGLVYLLDVPVGDVAVAATLDGAALRSRTGRAYRFGDAAITAVLIAP